MSVQVWFGSVVGRDTTGSLLVLYAFGFPFERVFEMPPAFTL